MNDYLLGLLTLPLGVAALGLCALALKAAYLVAGLLGKIGTARFGSNHPDYRYTLGAVVASAKRIVVLNKGTTGVVFFTGRSMPEQGSHIHRLKSALLAADDVNQPVDVAELIKRNGVDDAAPSAKSRAARGGVGCE